MITENTLFILGAGASKPYGYPTGAELRIDICKYFPTDTIIKKYMISKSSWSDLSIIEENNKCKTFCNAFNKSSTPSIDLFLSRNKSFIEIGKRAIFSSIYEAELKSEFRENIKKLDEDWYSYLFTKMTHTLITPDSYNEFKNNKVAFISFNYDRSLEHFLSESLINSFYDELKKQGNNSAKEINDLMKNLMPFEFIHVYGQIAPLDWQESIGFNYKKDIMKNHDTNISLINHFVSGIKIVEDRKTIDNEKIKNLISNYKKIFFLGFGYADENLEILGIHEILSRSHSVYGTAYGLTEKEINDIKKKFYISKNFNGESKNATRGFKIENTDCCNLLKKYL